MAKPKLAWHFLNSDGLLRNGEQPPPDGVWLCYRKPLIMCSAGLHASYRVIDALGYALGPIICRVKVGSNRIEEGDKLVSSTRQILWRSDATNVLREFSRWCALQVADNWDMPDVVREYLTTGDERIRSAAWSAAWSAARSAVGSAAESAARSAARSTAESAAWSAARSAARSAAWSAAWSAARSAAWSAAWSAVGSAARSTAESAARSAQSDKLEEMLFVLGSAVS